MNQCEAFLTKISQKDSEKRKLVTHDIINSDELLITKTAIRKWFYESDSQGGYTRSFLQHPPRDQKAAPAAFKVEDLKSYKFLKERLNLTDTDVQAYSRMTFEQHLKYKNVSLEDDGDVQDDDLAFDDALREDDVYD